MPKLSSHEAKLRMMVDACDIEEGKSLYYFCSGPAPAKDSKFACPPRMKHEKKSNLAHYNVMGDPRVRRGSYALDVGPVSDKNPFYPCAEMIQKDPLCQLYLRRLNKCAGKGRTKEIVLSSLEFKACLKRLQEENNREIKPPPGKANTEMQTDEFIEYLHCEPFEYDASAQTEPIGDFDYRLLGCPGRQREKKVGDDVETQVYPGDLFDFDGLVFPAVINCANAVVEQALLELMMETELESLLEQQRAYEKRMLLEVQRLEILQKGQQRINEENDKLHQDELALIRYLKENGEAVPLELFAKRNLEEMLDAAGDDFAVGIPETKCNEEVENIDVAEVALEHIQEEAVHHTKFNVVSHNILDDLIDYAVTNRTLEYLLALIEPDEVYPPTEGDVYPEYPDTTEE